MSLVTTAPIRATLIVILESLTNMLLNNDIIRRIPYPPSFSKIAAKIIDPAIGASTCALGSHRCTVNMGSFTINPPKVISHANVIDGKSDGNAIVMNIGICVDFE